MDKSEVLAAMEAAERWITTTGNEGLKKTIAAECALMNARKARAFVADLLETRPPSPEAGGRVVPEGWKLAPVEPTYPMLDKLMDWQAVGNVTAYWNMLAAAPAAPSVPSAGVDLRETMCCNGRECGCRGATVGEYLAWLNAEEIRGNAALLEEVSAALSYSKNFATAKPDIGKTEKEHILGLCSLIEKLTRNLP